MHHPFLLWWRRRIPIRVRIHEDPHCEQSSVTSHERLGLDENLDRKNQSENGEKNSHQKKKKAADRG